MLFSVPFVCKPWGMAWIFQAKGLEAGELYAAPGKAIFPQAAQKGSRSPANGPPDYGGLNLLPASSRSSGRNGCRGTAPTQWSP